MIPTRALVWIAVLPLLCGVVAVWAPVAIVPMLALDLVIALVAGVDLLLARGAVEASRDVAPVQSVGRWFDVHLELKNVGRRGLAVRVTDDAPGEQRGLPAAFRLPAGGAVRHGYELRVDQRGAHAFGPVTVRWRSPLGLWERQRTLTVDGSLRVYPDFGMLRRYGLRAPQDARKVPVRARRRPGGENEFERLRPYVPGDPYRHIDWRATARKNEFVTREYGQESNQNVLFLLDCGRMMSARSGSLTAFDHALNAAVMMGKIALEHGDRVGLLAFDSQVRSWIPPKGGARSGGRLVRGTYDLFPTVEEPDYALAFRHLQHNVRRRSLVVLLTSVVDEPNADLATGLVGALGARHLPLCVWIRDADVEAQLHAPAANREAFFVRAAAAELTGWRDRALASLRRKGALVVDADPAELTPALLGRYLEIKARRLL